jgi:regulation of enolase protein 1 (concanavalin A-like superfamily)
MLVSAGRGLAFQRRPATAGTSTHTAGGAGTAPRWVRLSRQGNVVSAWVSTDATSWTLVGRDTIALPATALVGLAVSSHTTSQLATASFSGVSISSMASASLPDGWGSRDIGTVGVAGSSVASEGTYTVRGAGADIWGTADAFRFVYRPLSGDGSIVARLRTVTGPQAWTKAGVMIRDSLNPGSAHAFMLVSAGRGLALQYRPSAGAITNHISGGAGTAPRWLRVARTGNMVTASVSTNGTTWATVGQVSVTLAPSVWVGLAVTSHDPTRLATGTFDSVTVIE